MLFERGVRLRGVERADLPTLVGWVNDPETRAQIARSSPISMAEEERWFDALLKSTTDVVFLIETWPKKPREEPRRLGMCGIHKIDWKNRNCSVGIVIGEAQERGRGYGTDAMTALVRHAVADLGLQRVELEVFPDNVAALRSYERVGFQREGVRRQALFKAGALRDLVLMSILASDVLTSTSTSSKSKPTQKNQIKRSKP